MPASHAQGVVPVIAAPIAANGIFTSAETAVGWLRKSRLAQLVDEGRAGARSVVALRDEPERFLATVQVGITVVGATVAAFSGAFLAGRLTPVLARVPGVGDAAEDVALAIVIAFVARVRRARAEVARSSVRARPTRSSSRGRSADSHGWHARSSGS